MAKRISVYPAHKNLMFSVGDREIKLSDSMPVKDAELIDAQYPGLYLKLTEEAAPAPDAAKAK